MQRHSVNSRYQGEPCRRMLHRAVIPGLLLTAIGSMPAQASVITGNTDVMYMEDAFPGLSVLVGNPYGTASASSVSPCSGTACQNSSGDPLTTFSGSSSDASGVGPDKSSADLSTGVLRAYAQENGTAGSSAAAGAGFWDA
ncbi:MAG: hypothetical protein M0Z84_01925 [Gammaproteobacteria bacterium]|nr:hypothetical protein [Gammaproteobacteria bacterium]